ncbi:hypothetical protein C8J57DRAFT_1076080 [Mycena rebaudengoi]|nr:hypothetical protein C8J57DRAFT_1076080 [Mycena rebaudengoi]
MGNPVSNNWLSPIVGSRCHSGIELLHSYVVTSALHNSGERFPEPACHPGTRNNILDQLLAWCADESRGSMFLWLHGSAGAGKSAVAQAFAGQCHQDGRLGGSFFFKRGHSDHGKWNGLVTTLAYQLAMLSVDLCSVMQNEIDTDKLVMGKSMPIQFEKLLVGPLMQVPSLNPIPVLVIDGLDECDRIPVQQEIVRLLGAILEKSVPVKILLVSRPEPYLREVLPAECQCLALSADATAYNDIRTYFQDQFRRIFQDHVRRQIFLDEPWPPAGVLNHLVIKSSGMFIYAATVIRFIDDQYYHPMDRLDLVLKLNPQSTAPLDDLYTQILCTGSDDHMLLLRILHAAFQANLPLSVGEIDAILNLRRGTSLLRLRGLHSVLRIEPELGRERGQPILCLHASLLDYLQDPARSKEWCILNDNLNIPFVYGMIRCLSTPIEKCALASRRDFYR